LSEASARRLMQAPVVLPNLGSGLKGSPRRGVRANRPCLGEFEPNHGPGAWTPGGGSCGVHAAEQLQAAGYQERLKVFGLLEDLMASMLVHQPDNPRLWVCKRVGSLLQRTEGLQHSRPTNSPTASPVDRKCLFRVYAEVVGPCGVEYRQFSQHGARIDNQTLDSWVSEVGDELKASISRCYQGQDWPEVATKMASSSESSENGTPRKRWSRKATRTSETQTDECDPYCESLETGSVLSRMRCKDGEAKNCHELTATWTTPLDAALDALDELSAQLPCSNAQIELVRRLIQLPSWEVGLPSDWTATFDEGTSADDLEEHSSRTKAIESWLTETYTRQVVQPVRRRKWRPSMRGLARFVLMTVFWGKLGRRNSTEMKAFPVDLPEAALQPLLSEFDNLGSVNFNVFRVSELTGNRPLQFVVWRVLMAMGSVVQFAISTHKLRTFLRCLEQSYRDVPYHTSEHAADVVQAVYVFLQDPVLRDNLTSFEKFALVIAAACHDVDHNGVNNGFHVKSMSALSLVHNDHSVLENHHCSVSWQLLQAKDANILSGLTPDQLTHFRSLFIEMILGTDMSFHCELLRDFKSVFGVRGNKLYELNEQERNLLRKFILHTADVSNPIRPSAINLVWANRVLNEFFGQGKHEEQNSLPVTFDKTKWAIAEGQIGFFKLAVVPTFELLWKLCPTTAVCLENVTANLKYWEDVKAGAKVFELVDMPYEVPECRVWNLVAPEEASSPRSAPTWSPSSIRRSTSLIMPPHSPSASSPRSAGTPARFLRGNTSGSLSLPQHAAGSSQQSSRGLNRQGSQPLALSPAHLSQLSQLSQLSPRSSPRSPRQGQSWNRDIPSPTLRSPGAQSNRVNAGLSLHVSAPQSPRSPSIPQSPSLAQSPSVALSPNLALQSGPAGQRQSPPNAPASPVPVPPASVSPGPSPRRGATQPPPKHLVPAGGSHG